MNDSRISVIVPVYNIQKYIEKCIISIKCQTYANLQIIVVDDGSTDESGKLCDELAESDPRMIVIHKKHGGLVSARKTGIDSADGDYILFVDGDDWIEPYWASTLIEEAYMKNADVVDGRFFLDVDSISKRKDSRLDTGIYKASELWSIMLWDDGGECKFAPYIWSKLWRKWIIEEIICEVDDRITFGEDVAVTYPALLLCDRVVVSDCVGYHYVQHANSIVHSITKDECNNIELLTGHLANIFSKHKLSERLLLEVEGYKKVALLQRCIDVFDCNAISNCVLMPWGGILCGSNIVIYGAGAIGQNLYKYVADSGLVKIVAWVDKEYEMYSLMRLPVESPEGILDKNFDYIIIAVNSKEMSSQIVKRLMDWGIERRKIRCII